MIGRLSRGALATAVAMGAALAAIWVGGSLADASGIWWLRPLVIVCSLFGGLTLLQAAWDRAERMLVRRSDISAHDTETTQ
jgi:hypothetical protein